MAGWTSLIQLIQEEIKQRTEEGCNTDKIAEKLQLAGQDEERLQALYDQLMALPVDPSFPFDEPSDLQEIIKSRPATNNHFKTQSNIDVTYFYGAWLGRCIGCALGKPLETEPFMSGKHNLPGWKLVYEWFSLANAYPICDYVPQYSPAKEQYDIKILACNQESLKENIRYMQTDDDIRYTVLGLILLEEKGLQWDSYDVGQLWHDKLTYKQVCTAETQSYLNFANITSHCEAGRPNDWKQKSEWVRTYRNPYREWIGAQIRVDSYAYCAAGNPQLAAELAYHDASFSHVKNGIYGAMFCAAMISAAFVEKNNDAIIEAGLAQIPQNCRLAHDVHTAVKIAKNAKNELALVEQLWEAFGQYNPVHTNNNAALCAAAVLYGGENFTKAISTAVLGGWDTDCNGATVGSIMGAKLGASNIPDHWKDPLHDTLYSGIPDFHPISIGDCAQRSYALYRKFREKNNI